MKNYIKDYNDDYYVFKLAVNQEKHIEYMNKGFNHIYNDNGVYKLYTYDGYIILDQESKKLFEIYACDDVLSIDSRGIVYELYRATSNDNAIVCTLQCNSNCVMCPCSEKSRRESEICSLEELQELIRYIPKTAPFLTITGGEPTLLKDNFFGLLKTLQYDFDETRFLLLTNGRAFSDYSFTQRFVECLPNNIRVGIPIYGYNETTHDIITQSAGSFKQAVIGIHNLLHYNIETEIRIVLTKQNIDNIEKIAKYVIKYFRDVACVNFMGLELMGNAAKNREKVWLPFEDAFNKSKKAIRLLIAHGVNTQLYNFPLCAVESAYWEICAKSISDYKVDFGDECQKCDLKEICGGVFDSTKRVIHFKGKPIKR
ncbi:His-Xaa-Ser system radical SAM maturase HxsC [Firmicutes bacterium AM55-24TS]|jgi:His-Xaa-Ser system radical SAM maturase HxsC|nr:His-Xaa-Ser system radical SAM maturase HxsC [Firmicutes bacterium AM55-24TS]